MASFLPQNLDGLADEAVATVRRWLAESEQVEPDPGAARLSELLRDPRGPEFALRFVDGVVRPEDRRVAARALERLSLELPDFLPPHLRAALLAGGGFARLAPWPIIPAARRTLRRMVDHLVLDATPDHIGPALERLGTPGTRLTVNLLGETVLGEHEATRRLESVLALLRRRDVGHVSVKVSAIASQLSLWGFEETVARVVDRLLPLYEYASTSPYPKLITLDMEEYHDLDLTVEAFMRLLSLPQLDRLEAGIALQAYLPDSVAALDRLTEWARARREGGGAGIKVRIVKGANLPMERVDASLHGWTLAPYGSKVETDANYKRLVARALTPERAEAVRIGVAGHNLFDLAFAWLLARERGLADRLEVEMLLGMAPGHADAVRRDAGGLLLYTPLVHPEDFDSAVGYLVRRLDENASEENFLSAAFHLDDAQLFAREEGRFRASIAALDDSVPAPRRTQDRGAGQLPRTPRPFANAQDTDPSLAGNREWAARVLARSVTSTLGADTLAAARVEDAAALDALLAAAARAGEAWGARAAAERAELLDAAGEVLEAFRGRLIEVMASETGKTIGEGDPEVSEAVDFAHYYAELAREIETVDHARLVPARLTLAAPPWNFPVSIPAGSVLGPLAAGSAVVLKPAPQARWCSAVLAEALWEAGIPREVLVLVDVDEDALGRHLVTHPAIERVVLTGSYETAALFRSWRPELALQAETSGKNAIVVTPSADYDLAVADLVQSAFGHAGQKCSAASLAILVGSAASSERLRRQLVDAVRSMRVGYPADPSTRMGPLIEPAEGRVLRALTELGHGEEWLVQPRRLDDSGRLWSPGVRTGVRAGSEFHLTECFAPVLGLMEAASLDEAIALQNAVPFGLTAGLHSLDVDEIARWTDAVEAGNLYVNRGITGAVVRRQPFGGWKRSRVGTGAKAGGPNYVAGFGTWEPEWPEPRSSLTLTGVSDRVRAVIEAAQPGMGFEEFDRVRTAARSDEQAWTTFFAPSDATGLPVERNVLRYRPTAVLVRLCEGAPLGDLVRAIVAATRTRSPLWVSSALPLPARLLALLDEEPAPVRVVEVHVEPDAAFLERVASGAPVDRIRLIGGDPLALAHALHGSPDVAVHAGPVTGAGRVELLAYVLEQAVSITAHRFGQPVRELLELPL